MLRRWMQERTPKFILRTIVRLLPSREPNASYLRQQVLASWRKESRHLKWLGIDGAHAILDLGCGPGDFTQLLSELVPDAAITALDKDEQLLQLARERTASSRISFLHSSAEDTMLPAESFDFVIARLLFQHLPDPGRVVREAHRVLRPGGKLVIVDDDDGLFGIVEPAVPRFRELLDKYGEAQRQRGGNRNVGRWLTRLLAEAGFCQIDLDGIVSHSDEAGLERLFPQLDGAPLNWLRREGFITRREREEYRAARTRFYSAPNPFAITILLVACGAKPS